MIKTYHIPDSLTEWIELQLNEIKSSLFQSKKIAASIQQMADFYQTHPHAATPWHETWALEAQLAYYLPLNYLRSLRVFEELHKHDFFDTTMNWFEFGSGLTPTIDAFYESNKSKSPNSHKIQNLNLIETSIVAKKLSADRLNRNYAQTPQWVSQFSHSMEKESLMVLSYSLTELSETPKWLWKSNSIVIIEPSTSEDARNLMSLRSEALKQGYSIIAPCTHSLDCPLLTKSKKDWCHDRFAVQRPQWMLDIEAHLPFHNATLTLSYLALKKSTEHSLKNSNANLSSENSNLNSKIVESQNMRVVGDFLNEKGKSRQMICRGEQREFISYLHKTQKPEIFHRGDLLTIEGPLQIKSSEIRPNEKNTINIK